MKYRKKPIVIEAVLISEDGAQSLFELVDGSPNVDIVRGHHLSSIPDKVICVHILTLEGKMIGNLGDYLIRGIKGEFYPCKPDIFAATYEPAEYSQITRLFRWVSQRRQARNPS